MDKVDILVLLDEIDEFRRNHQNERESPPDWCMRAIEAIIAERAGFKSRTGWTSILKDGDTRYRRDLESCPLTFFG